jgi:hypothetical protein
MLGALYQIFSNKNSYSIKPTLDWFTTYSDRTYLITYKVHLSLTPVQKSHLISTKMN